MTMVWTDDDIAALLCAATEGQPPTVPLADALTHFPVAPLIDFNNADPFAALEMDAELQRVRADWAELRLAKDRDDTIMDDRATENAQDRANGTGGQEDPRDKPNGAGKADKMLNIDIRSSWAVPPPAREWLVSGWLPANRIAMLAGRGAAGKSQIALQLSHAITADLPAGSTRTWFEGGPEIPGGQDAVAFCTWEDDGDEILRLMLSNPEYDHGAPEFDKAVGGRFHFIDLAGQGPLWAVGESHRSFGELTPAGVSLRAACESLRVRLLIVDALSSAFAANENDRAAVRAFLSSWDRWARDTGCAVLLIAHPPKSEGQDNHYSGSTDWRAGVRSLLVLSRPKGVADRAKIMCDKLNAARTPDPIALGSPRWWHTIKVDPLEIDNAGNLELRESVVDALKEHGPMNRTQIRAAVQKGETAVDEILARMELNHSLAMTIKGNGKFIRSKIMRRAKIATPIFRSKMPLKRGLTYLAER